MTTENVNTKADPRNGEKGQHRAVAPPVDIYENEDKLVIVADMPGVAKDDVHIHFEKGQLTFGGKRTDVASGTLLAAEYTPHDFERVFALPQGIDAERISAELDSGVLRILLPKSAALKPRRIEVKAG